MDKSLSFGVVVGASVAGSFSRSIGSVKGQFNTLGDSIKQLSHNKGLIERFEKDQAAVEKARLRLGHTQQEVLKLKLALRKDPENQGLAKDLERAQRKAAKLGTALDDQRTKLSASKRAMVSAGIGVKDYAAEYTRLGKAIDKAQQKQARFKKYASRRDAAASKLSDMRGEMVGGLAALYGVGRLVGEAADFGRGLTRLSTVANAQNVGKAIAESRHHAIEYARKSLASETEIIDIEYALNSAGLDAQTARIGSELVSKVATVTGGAAEQVGEVVATTFNNLGSQLEGSTAERLARIGDLLTKTQFKFQIRDFGQLGESMKLATPALAQYNVNLEQGATLIGALNSAGLQGSMAGTALSATFRNLSKASKEFNFELVRGADGGLDFIATLQNLSNSIGGFEAMDQRTIDDLQKVFGDEGVRMVSLLGPKLKELAAAQEDVAKSSRNVVDSSYERFLEDERGQITQFTNNIRTLGMAFAGALLPSVNAVLRPVTAFVGHVGRFVEKYPALGKIIIGAVGGFVAFKGVMMAVTAAQWAWNAAMLANPIGLVVAGIGAAAALLIHYWEPVTEFFSSLWDRLAGFVGKFVERLGGLAGQVLKLWEPVTEFFGGLWDKVGGFVGAIWGGAKKLGSGASELGAAVAGNVAAPPAPALASSHSATTISAPITINAAPGMDERAIAEQVDRKLREREQRAGARRRGALYD